MDIFTASGQSFEDDFLIEFIDTDADDPNLSFTADKLGGSLLDGLIFISDAGGDTLLFSDTILETQEDMPPNGPDTLTLVFGGLSGTSASLFGETARAVLSFIDGSGTGAATLSVQSDVAPIPLPATLPALLLGLGFLGVAARRRG